MKELAKLPSQLIPLACLFWYLVPSVWEEQPTLQPQRGWSQQQGGHWAHPDGPFLVTADVCPPKTWGIPPYTAFHSNISLVPKSRSSDNVPVAGPWARKGTEKHTHAQMYVPKENDQWKNLKGQSTVHHPYACFYFKLAFSSCLRFFRQDTIIRGWANSVQIINHASNIV